MERNATAAAEVYARDAKLLAPRAEVLEGREAIAAFWRAGIESGIREIELDTLELVQHGTLAHEIGRYVLQLEPPGGEVVVDRGKYLLVHERQEDGSWRRAVEMFNPDGPPTQGPARSSERETGGRSS